MSGIGLLRTQDSDNFDDSLSIWQMIMVISYMNALTFSKSSNIKPLIAGLTREEKNVCVCKSLSLSVATIGGLSGAGQLSDYI